MPVEATPKQCAALGAEIRKLLDQQGEGWVVTDDQIAPHLQDAADAVLNALPGREQLMALHGELRKLIDATGWGWAVGDDKIEPFLQPLVDAVVQAGQGDDTPPQQGKS